MNPYAFEKQMEFERERLSRMQTPEPPKRPRKTIWGPLAAGAGRTLRRMGEGLEHWGAPPHAEHEHAHGNASHH
jgi:hypothetical protein